MEEERKGRTAGGMTEAQVLRWLGGGGARLMHTMPNGSVPSAAIHTAIICPARHSLAGTHSQSPAAHLAHRPAAAHLDQYEQLHSVPRAVAHCSSTHPHRGRLCGWRERTTAFAP